MKEYFAYSDAGLINAENQDSVFCGCEGEKGLFMVADGMGGHEDGARASRTIRNFAESWWQSGCFYEMDFFGAVESLKQMLAEANSEIFCETPAGAVCGSTVVLLWVDGPGYALLTAGDSRCYRVTDDVAGGGIFIDIISTDDVWENNPDNIRGLSDEEIVSDPNYGRLSRAVGVSRDFTCTVRCDCIECTTAFAICSDGIYKYVDDQILYSGLERTVGDGDLEDCSSRITESVFESGAPDNLSLILLSV